MCKWIIYRLYNQYLLTLGLAFLLLTSCNTGEMTPATLQANPGTTTIDTAYYTKLLFEGILGDDLNKVVLSRMCGIPVEELNKDGDTPLTAAVIYQHQEAIGYLIQQGADINQKDETGYAPLHYAVMNIGAQLSKDDTFDSKMPHILCSYQADVNIQDHEGNTPLHYAVFAYKGKDFEGAPKEHIQILLEADAQLLPNNNGDTPLTIAKFIKRRDIVELLEVEKDKKEKGIIQSTIPSLGALSKEKLVNYLLSPSNEAQEYEQKIRTLYERLRINLSSKVNIHIDTNFIGGNKLIHLATEAHNLSIVEFLLQYDPSQVNYTNLIGQIPLHIVAKNGDLQVAEYLLKRPNMNLNALSIGGYSPLHYAIIHGHNHVLGCLVQSGANINMKDNNGKTCLHYAAYNGSLEAARYLLQNGANVNAGDNEGDTPLHDAVHNGSLEVIDYLLRNEANINEKNNYGNTPLDIATARQYRKGGINKSNPYNIVNYLGDRNALLGKQIEDEDDEGIVDQDAIGSEQSDDSIEDDNSDEDDKKAN
jgi:ankyrin repeat protein